MPAIYKLVSLAVATPHSPQYWPGTGFIESFTYDAMNGLATAQVTGRDIETFSYDAIGNIVSKSGLGTYSYPAPGSPKPHAVERVSSLGSYTYDDNGNLLTAPGRSVPWIWSSFDMPLKWVFRPNVTGHSGRT